MPEGDSVFLLARRLRAGLDGARLVRAELRVPAHAGADLVGVTVLGHETHGKHLLTRFDDGRTLHTHLRMDGSWSVVRPGRRLPRDVLGDVRVLLGTEQGPTAYGLSLPVVDLLASRDEADVIGHLGPDPLRADWDAAEAVRRLRGAGPEPIVSALLDQTRLAGLGNLWVNELCFLRGLSPWTPTAEVDLEPLVALAARCLRHSAHVPGAYQVTTGRAHRGRHDRADSHWVAGRAHRPCLRCRTTVEVVAEVPGQHRRRRTWWCPRCQPGPGPAGAAGGRDTAPEPDQPAEPPSPG